MNNCKHTEKEVILVAIDISKSKHDVLVELSNGQRKKFIIRNSRPDFTEFSLYLKSLKMPCIIGIEPTADYHRNLAYFLKIEGFDVKLMSSIAVARTREALHNSWDKNDPKDAQVILHLLKSGITQFYYDPVIEGNNDLQELSKTHFQVSLRKTKLQHSLLNHYLPLYFPEAEKFMCTARAHWFGKLLLQFPTPSSVLALEKEEFIRQGTLILKKKHSKDTLLGDFYECAKESIGVPISLDSESIKMFRLILTDHLELAQKRITLEKTAHETLSNNSDYKILRSIPGIGPIIALTILAETGNLKRFGHERQFLKFCGLDLATQQSGSFRGGSIISKRGNGRLRCALWLAATVAIRMKENSFRRKFERYIQSAPDNADLKRKAYTAVTAKMARIAYRLVKEQKVYRPYFEEAVPGGRTRSYGRGGSSLTS